jgi:molybdopterin molybdotransferase
MIRKSSIEGLFLNKFQLIIISGGVSVGDRDYVPEVLEKLGVNILIHRVMIKPGKHFLFGTKENQYIFGFPGNPVSSFVLFKVFAKPFLMAWMGWKGDSIIMPMPLTERFIRNSSELLLFLPAAFTRQDSVSLVEYHGSSHVHAYMQAQCIMETPVGVSNINNGELVHVRRL